MPAIKMVWTSNKNGKRQATKKDMASENHQEERKINTEEKMGR